MSDETTFNTTGIDQLLKALEGKLPKARLGILGSTAQRGATMELDEEIGEMVPSGVSSVSNAEIGLKHEFGGPSRLPNGRIINLPERSFLRVPIIENYQRYLNGSGAFDRATLRQVLKEGTILRWVKKLGIIGEQVVFEAFETAGFGRWQPSNMDFKRNHQTLVETQQLRNSIISEVTEGD